MEEEHSPGGSSIVPQATAMTGLAGRGLPWEMCVPVCSTMSRSLMLPSCTEYVQEKNHKSTGMALMEMQLGSAS